jgi:hypothetical protein
MIHAHDNPEVTDGDLVEASIHGFCVRNCRSGSCSTVEG